MSKGLRDGAETLDDQETQQYKSMVGTALCVGQDRPETQYATKETARFMSGPHARSTMHAQNPCANVSAKNPCPTGIFHVKKRQLRSGL